MYVLKDALERAGSLEPAKIREALAATNLTDGPGMIVGYDAVKFDASGQNENASPVIVQVADSAGSSGSPSGRRTPVAPATPRSSQPTSKGQRQLTPAADSPRLSACRFSATQYLRKCFLVFMN